MPSSAVDTIFMPLTNNRKPVRRIAPCAKEIRRQDGTIFGRYHFGGDFLCFALAQQEEVPISYHLVDKKEGTAETVPSKNFGDLAIYLT